MEQTLTKKHVSPKVGEVMTLKRKLPSKINHKRNILVRNKVKTLKNDYGVTYIFVAEKAGIHVEALNRWVNNTDRNFRNNKLDSLDAIIKLYNI